MGSHSNGKGPMPADCPSPGTGDCERLGIGCFGAYQLTSGCAPQGCMRACGHVVKAHGGLCQKWKARGYKYCWVHSKVFANGQNSRTTNAQRGIDVQMPSFYGKVLGKTLTQRLEEVLETPPHEQLQVWTELQLIKEHCANVVQMYGAVADARATNPDAVQIEQLVAVSELMKEACAFVIEQVGAVQSIENNAKDKISVGHFSLIMAQVARLMYQVCGDEHADIAVEFDRRLKDEIRFPKPGEAPGAQGTVVNVNVNLESGGPSSISLAQSLGVETLLIGGTEVPVADLARES